MKNRFQGYLSSYRTDILFLLSIVVLTGLIYYPVLDAEYIYDSRMIAGLGQVHGESSESVWSLSYGDLDKGDMWKGGYYRPLTSASFVLLQSTGPKGQRIANLLIFWGITVIFFIILKLKKWEKPKLYPLITIFSLYPIHVDNVLWAVGRCDLLMLFFFALVLLFMELSDIKGNNIMLYGANLLFIAGLFTKEPMVFTIPAIIFYGINSKRKFSYPFHIINFLGVGFFFFVKSSVTGIASMTFEPLNGIGSAIAKVMSVSGYYFKTLIFPFRHDIFITEVQMLNTFNSILGAISITVFCLASLYAIVKRRDLLFPLGLIAIIIPHVLLSFTLIEPFKASSRYLVLPFFGLLFICFMEFKRLKVRGKAVITISALLALLMGVQSLLHTWTYEDEIAYWDYYLSNDPDLAVNITNKIEVLLNKKKFFEAYLLIRDSDRMDMDSKYRNILDLFHVRVLYMQCKYDEAWEIIKNLEVKIESDNWLHRSFCLAKTKLLFGFGRNPEALKLITDSIRRTGPKNYADLLHRFWLGRLDWDKAELVNRRFGNHFEEEFLKHPVGGIKNSFQTSTRLDKMWYFRKMGNYEGALKVLDSIELSDKVALHKIYCLYKTGKSAEAEPLLSYMEKTPKGLKLLTLFFIQEIPLMEKTLYYGRKIRSGGEADRELESYLDEIELMLKKIESEGMII